MNIIVHNYCLHVTYTINSLICITCTVYLLNWLNNTHNLHPIIHIQLGLKMWNWKIWKSKVVIQAHSLKLFFISKSLLVMLLFSYMCCIGKTFNQMLHSFAENIILNKLIQFILLAKNNFVKEMVISLHYL